MSDRAEMKPLDLDHTMRLISRLEIVFKKLWNRYPLSSFQDAVRAAARLDSYFKSSEFSSQKIRKKKDSSLMNALDLLTRGITNAWKVKEDDLQAWVFEPQDLTYRGLEILLGLEEL